MYYMRRWILYCSKV